MVVASPDVIHDLRQKPVIMKLQIPNAGVGQEVPPAITKPLPCRVDGDFGKHAVRL